MNYNIDFDKFIQKFLPPDLRKQKLFLFLHSLLYPLQYLSKNIATVYFPFVSKKARYNSQVIKFEKILNDTFNTTGIFINTSSRIDRVYTFNQIENTPLYFYNASENKPVYISNKVEYIPQFDFTVNVPLAVYNISLSQIRAMVERIKVVGVNYNIVSY